MDAVDLDVLLKDIGALEGIIEAWDEEHQNTMTALLRAHEDLHKEALTRLIRRLKQEPAAVEALKEALGDEVIYAVLRRHNIVKPSLHERLEDALASVRPYLQGHDGDVELVSVTPPDTVEIRLVGSCDGCPASSLTLREGVEKAIHEHCPEITTINKARGSLNAKPAGVDTIKFVSPFARGADDGWRYACDLRDIPEGQVHLARIDGDEVILSRFEDRVTCFENACAHMGMPLDGGATDDDAILTCPHHGFRFSLQSGECLTVPEIQLQTHAVRVVGERVEVRAS